MTGHSDRAERALEEISRTLHSIDTSLKDIAKSVKRRSGRLTFENYQEGETPNGATTPAGSAETAADVSLGLQDAEPGAYGTGTSQPYS